MSICNKCESGIQPEEDSTSWIQCVNCANVFHLSCAGVTKTMSKNMCTYKSFGWFCESCNESRDFRIAIMVRMKNIEDTIKIQCERQAKYENEISDLKKLVMDKRCASSCNPLTNTPRSFSNVRPNSDTNMSTATPTNVKKRSWVDMARGTTSNDTQTPYQHQHQKSAKRHRTVAPKAKRDPVLIVRAKNQPDRMKVKETINQQLHPLDDPVKSVKETAKGDVIVVCNDTESLNTVRAKLNDAIGNEFDVTEPKEIQPRLKIVGFDATYCDKTKFVDIIRRQNDDVFTESSTVELLQEPKQRASGANTATIGVDNATFERALRKQKLGVGWTKCRVYEQVDVLRCFLCCMFGHEARSCEMNEKFCALCGCTGHDVQTCTKKNERDKYRCINCCRAMANNGRQDIDVCHSAMSMQCPLLRRKVEQKKKLVRYKE